MLKVRLSYTIYVHLSCFYSKYNDQLSSWSVRSHLKPYRYIYIFKEYLFQIFLSAFSVFMLEIYLWNVSFLQFHYCIYIIFTVSTEILHLWSLTFIVGFDKLQCQKLLIFSLYKKFVGIGVSRNFLLILYFKIRSTNYLLLPKLSVQCRLFEAVKIVY